MKQVGRVVAVPVGASEYKGAAWVHPLRDHVGGICQGGASFVSAQTSPILGKVFSEARKQGGWEASLASQCWLRVLA